MAERYRGNGDSPGPDGGGPRRWASIAETRTTPLLLWRGRGAAANVSLLGSIHALSDPSVPPEIEGAYAEADGVIFECDVARFDPAVTLLPQGATLRTLLSPPTYALLTNRAEELGLEVHSLLRADSARLPLGASQSAPPPC